MNDEVRWKKVEPTDHGILIRLEQADLENGSCLIDEGARKAMFSSK